MIKPSQNTVYALVDPRSGEVRYIGITVDIIRRFREHLKYAHADKSYRGRWISNMLREGIYPDLKILEVTGDRNAERWWISFYRNEIGVRLTNLTDGGEGTLGRKFSQESRVKMSKAARCHSPNRLGKHHSEEARARMSESRKRWYRDVFMSLQWYQKIAEKV